jgi:hypothetical protein
MWQGMTSPLGIVITLGIAAVLAVVTALVIVSLRTDSGNSRRAKKADALRKIEEVNRVGYLDDVGTIVIEPHERRRYIDGDRG